jgi:hypothetical protein
VKPEERSARDLRVRADRARGIGVAVIAAREGISERQVRRIVAAGREETPPPLALEPVDPDAVVREVLDLHDDALASLADLASGSAADHVRLGAIVRRVEIGVQRLALLRSFGLVPDLRRFRGERAFSDAIEALGVLLVRHDVPAPVMREFLELAESVQSTPPRRLHAVPAQP